MAASLRMRRVSSDDSSPASIIVETSRPLTYSKAMYGVCVASGRRPAQITFTTLSWPSSAVRAVYSRRSLS